MHWASSRLPVAGPAARSGGLHPTSSLRRSLRAKDKKIAKLLSCLIPRRAAWRCGPLSSETPPSQKNASRGAHGPGGGKGPREGGVAAFRTACGGGSAGGAQAPKSPKRKSMQRDFERAQTANRKNVNYQAFFKKKKEKGKPNDEILARTEFQFSKKPRQPRQPRQ
eukprot:COSAG04_NODE_8861_length_923_cov_0.959951_2_plen_165_part_01